MHHGLQEIVVEVNEAKKFWILCSEDKVDIQNFSFPSRYRNLQTTNKANAHNEKVNTKKSASPENKGLQRFHESLSCGRICPGLRPKP